MEHLLHRLYGVDAPAGRKYTMKIAEFKVKQEDAWPGGRCEMRLSRIITEKYHTNEAFPSTQNPEKISNSRPTFDDNCLLNPGPKLIHLMCSVNDNTVSDSEN